MSDENSGTGRYVLSTAIRRALEGREGEILDAINIPWRTGRPHIRCPYPDHADANPSWRWDEKNKRAYCTCGSHSVFGVLMRLAAIEFDTAKLRAAELLDRPDLIRQRRRKRGAPVPDPNGPTAAPGCRLAEYAGSKAFIEVQAGVTWLASMVPGDITTPKPASGIAQRSTIMSAVEIAAPLDGAGSGHGCAPTIAHRPHQCHLRRPRPYEQYAEFADRDAKNRFEELVLGALREAHPELFDGRAA